MELLHTRPDAQSVSSVQLVKQVCPRSSQRYGSQLVGAGITHVAAPLHLGAAVSDPLAQNSTPHVVVAPGSTQFWPFVPSQKPPQAPEPGHAGRPFRGPPGTEMQVPSDPAWSHDWHCPSQAESQHTPSTQWVFVHWLDAPHGDPSPSFATHM
jgi:hypothetical protein